MTESAAENANAAQDWDGEIGGDQKTEEVVVEKTPEEIKKHEEQVERTKLGRKVKEQEERLVALTETNKQLLEAIQRLETNMASEKPKPVAQSSDLFDQMVAVAGEPPVEFVTTPRETYLYQQWQTKAMGLLQESQGRVYRDGYLATLNTLKEMGGENHEEVVKMVTSKGSPFNIYRETGRGDVDARMNYLEALNSLMTKGKATFKSGTNKSGVSQGQSSEASFSKTVNMTEEAKAYAKHLGMSDEDIAAAMKRPIGRVG